MLKQTRLTSAESTRRVLPTSLNAAARRVAAATFFAFGLLFLLPDAAAEPPSRRIASSASQAQTSGRLSQLAEPTQDLDAELAQLEFQFQQAQKIGSERVDELTPQIAALLDAARQLATQTKVNADEELAERAQTLVSQLNEFQRFIDASSSFFYRLAELDAASLDEEATRSFFASLSPRSNAAPSSPPYFSEVSDSPPTPNATLATYRAELNCVAESLNALQTLEIWNAFVESRGLELERFYVAPDAAENALNFLTQVRLRQGLPQEYQLLKRRADEWRFTSLNRVAIQRKILLALEAELTPKRWTFTAAPDKIYYLQQPPRPGRNVCFADAKGALSFVDVPENAPETLTSESSQRLFLQSLVNEARSISETLRADDPARWYAAWSAFLSRLQTTEALDPLVQYRLLHVIAATLSTGDFYFAQRLAPTLRMLNVPRLSDVDSFDVFQAENVETQELRRFAKTRIAFLPTDRLTVDKTTAELDAQTERFSFVYRRVGWLDRDFSGAWRCRRPENAPLPVGDLYVLLLDSDATRSDVSTTSAAALNGAAPESSPRFRWLKVGFSDGRQTTLKFATTNVCRGSIVLCRSRVGSPKPVAERGELERLLRR